MFSRREWRRYKQAEGRLRESIQARAYLPAHTYPRREGDLRVMQIFHDVYGIPKPGAKAAIRRWWGWLNRGGPYVG